MEMESSRTLPSFGRIRLIERWFVHYQCLMEAYLLRVYTPTGILFFPKSRKINLISTLVYRGLMICSPCKLNQELENIHRVICDNGYPVNIIKRAAERKFKR